MIRLIVLLLTVLTGFSGLVYEVTWQRYLATLLGSHSEATAAVLGLFLGGLAVGYSLFGVITRRLVARADAQARSAPLLIVYGVVEAGIGVFALIFPFLFKAVQALSFQIPHGSAGFGFALDVFLSALLILPPAILMGGTIPILTQALARTLEDATRFHALVYAFNTAGAFAGALAAGFWLVPSLGLVGVLRWMGGINLIAGAVFLGIGLLRPAPVRTAPARTEAPQRVAGFARFAAVALLTGFAMMTLQTVLIRLSGLSFGSSQFTFSMVVAVFVLCIALGSFFVSALPRIPSLLLPACLWSLLILLAVLYRVADNAPYFPHALRALYRDNANAFYVYQGQAFLGLLFVLLVPVALSGAVLPLIFHALRDKVGDLGEIAGRLYSWNTLGSLLGALIGGYALLFWFDLHHTYRFAMAAIAIAAVLTTMLSFPVGRVAPAAILATALAAIAMLPAWRTERLSSGTFRKRAALANTWGGPTAFFRSYRQGVLRFYDDDPVASISVKAFEGTGGANLAIVTNGKSDSAIPGDSVTTILLALIPALLAKEPARAFVVGYGTGVTAGELAALEDVREVTVAEISPGVIAAAPQFDYGNLNASTNPKVRIVRGDAYRTLLRSEGDVDLIVSEPSNPWVTGIEMLYSREFLEAARDRLTPGGVHAQWFHSYETDNETLAIVLRTYQSVFPHSSVWFTVGTDLLLIGVNDPEAAFDLERLQRRFDRADFKAGFERAKVPSFAALLAHEILPLDVLTATRLEGEPHTLLHPILSNAAARAFFAGSYGKLPVTSMREPAEVGMRNSLLRRHAAAQGGQLAEIERVRVVEETCRNGSPLCAAVMARWLVETPESPVRDRMRSKLASNQTIMRSGRLNVADRLVYLYDESAARVPEKITAAQASQATQLYAELYHHGVPFSREALMLMWRRCEADPEQAQACFTARMNLKRTLGDLGE
jgi:predicted membrane-bound spermidine synthase